ncbi:hypothetical protein EI77_03929 [Prosthecobacter fusiformis]|uniref:MerC mercury resistance protein n=1 Tax=Prosthecobacter fusiformis TaxID=48464 RepID=A0A4R7RLG5_9BACT|nr:hypothetical protein EI77_03929 [Prosthecobacter fusiformis]
MNKLPCCTEVSKRRVTHFTGFLLSSVTLILMPKCPVCMAAYVALITGISVSTAVASHLRWGLFMACLSVLACLVVHGLHKLWRGSAGSKIRPR